ncbi:MAG: imidazolonepropionase [Clostridia bacterium]|nr:imidazolonepropionase [Clostridia bacterium]
MRKGFAAAGRGDVLIKNIGVLATPTGMSAASGSAQGGCVSVMKDAYVLSRSAVIVEVGTGEPPEVPESCLVVDAGRRLVTPGLVDAHTHLVFGGWRQNELDLKLKGATYLEILEAGGGILSTVRATRAASEEELADRAGTVLDEMFSLGTTTCEAKSGYGLEMATEMKQLEVMRKLNEHGPVELVSTFMGAHALPGEYREDRESYVKLLCDEMIPEAVEKGVAEFCDVFCEQGVFTAEESVRILEAAKACGLGCKIHTDEICDIGGTEAAEKVRAVSAEHLIKADADGIERLARGGVIACLLPCTSFYLGAEYANARGMIEAGVPVAMATDFNPGSCPSNNMQLVINVGCLKYRMTPEEVLTAVTLNGAAAIGRADRIGSVEPGKQADLVIWDAPDLPFICYRMGSDLVSKVVKKGVVYE